MNNIARFLDQKAKEKQDQANAAAVAKRRDLAELRDEIADLLRTLSQAMGMLP